MMWPAWYSPPKAFPHRSATVHTMINLSAELLGIKPGQIRGESRCACPVSARAAISIVLRERGWSYARIGRALGNRDHRTVMHAIETFPNRIRKYPEANELLFVLRVLAA